MNNRLSRSRLIPTLALPALILGALGATTVAQANDLLGFYVGAAYGQAHIRARLGELLPSGSGSLPAFDGTHNAYQAMLGIRALSFLGAEITYVDLGQRSIVGPPVLIAGLPGGSFTPSTQQASQKGEAAYALLYLPVPIIDVYVKAGISRITTDMSFTESALFVFCAQGHPDCNVYTAARSSTDTSFAYGAGLQWKLGNWAVRGEYERFDAAGANPSLLSIGMTYWIL